MSLEATEQMVIYLSYTTVINERVLIPLKVNSTSKVTQPTSGPESHALSFYIDGTPL